MQKFSRALVSRCSACQVKLVFQNKAFITSKSTKEQVLSSRRAKSDLDDRRRLNFANPQKVEVIFWKIHCET